MLAVGSDDPSPASGPKVSVYELSDPDRRWRRAESVPVPDPVHDLAFAPNVGRSYALLAVASSSDLRIVTLKPTYAEDGDSAGEQQTDGRRYEVRDGERRFPTSSFYRSHNFRKGKKCPVSSAKSI